MIFKSIATLKTVIKITINNAILKRSQNCLKTDPTSLPTTRRIETEVRSNSIPKKVFSIVEIS
jgi:hypothetical protein